MTSGIFRSNTFTLLLTASNPQQAETPACVGCQNPIFQHFTTVHRNKKHSFNFYNKKLVSCGRRGRFEINVSFQRRNNPPIGNLWFGAVRRRFVCVAHSDDGRFHVTRLNLASFLLLTHIQT